MLARPETAATFHALHQGLLILPKCMGCRVRARHAGLRAKAIATSSAAVAWSQEDADGHHFPTQRLVTSIGDIARVVSVPITCDAEGGYSDDPKQAAENIGKLIDAGAVGINLEDGEAAARAALAQNRSYPRDGGEEGRKSLHQCAHRRGPEEFRPSRTSH